MLYDLKQSHGGSPSHTLNHLERKQTILQMKGPLFILHSQSVPFPKFSASSISVWFIYEPNATKLPHLILLEFQGCDLVITKLNWKHNSALAIPIQPHLVQYEDPKLAFRMDFLTFTFDPLKLNGQIDIERPFSTKFFICSFWK